MSTTKTLVFSDSHGNTARMAEAVRRERPEAVFHLGDVVRDTRVLAAEFPALPRYSVCGNCDAGSDVPAERLVILEGKKILMTHGHHYHVKSGEGAAVAAARQAGADALLFGHTHRPLCDYQNGLWVMNPGSVGSILGGTYGVLVVEHGEIFCYTCDIS